VVTNVVLMSLTCCHTSQGNKLRASELTAMPQHRDTKPCTLRCEVCSMSLTQQLGLAHLMSFCSYRCLHSRPCPSSCSCCQTLADGVSTQPLTKTSPAQHDVQQHGMQHVAAGAVVIPNQKNAKLDTTLHCRQYAAITAMCAIHGGAPCLLYIVSL
jgi:hypothetical protein